MPLLAPHELIAWADASDAPLLRAIAGSTSIRLAACGSPDARDAVVLSRDLGIERFDELRPALRAAGPSLLWLSTTAPSRDDRRHVREAGVTAFGREPWFDTIGEASGDARDSDTFRVVPLLRRSPAWRQARDAVEQFGAPRCLSGVFACGAGQGSLFARLYDAMDLLDSIGGEVELVDAAQAGPRSDVPESLRRLRGHLTVNLRFAGDRCGALTLSDDAGGWHRRITLLGERGTLAISDDGFEWSSADQTLDVHREPGHAWPADLIVDQIARTLDRPEGDAPPPETDRVLALCEAARLSARTGQGESPRRVVEMFGGE